MKLRKLLMQSLVTLAALTAASASEASNASNASNASQGPRGRVLVVLSGANYVSLKGGGRHPTGYFLSEMMVPVLALQSAGYQLVFATPRGTVPVPDKVSVDVRWFRSQAQFQYVLTAWKSLHALRKPIALESLTEDKLSLFAGVVFPGGHAPMEDLYRNIDVGRILMHFHRLGQPTALICHAPIALYAAHIGQRWVYSGYRMTVFSTAEEQQEENAGHLDGRLTFYVQDALKRAGGQVSVGQPWTSHVVVDHELITAQNPMSDVAFAKAILLKLAAREISR